MWTRRAALTTLAAAPLLRGAGNKPIRLGGPTFLKSEDPVALAQEHRRLGYSAAYCPKVDSMDSSKIRAIREAFAKENVVIAEVGAWKNLLDPDPVKRKDSFDYVADRLALAEAVQATCCVDIAGSFNPTVWYGPHPGNLSQEFFDATVETCRRLIDQVNPKHTKYTVEMMGWSVPNSPDAYVKLIKAVDRKAFAVHLDVCNGINSPERFYNNAGYIRECFQKLGPWIMSCHAKDVAWIPELQMRFAEVIPGRGQVDYTAYLTELAKLPHQPPLMLEHLKDDVEYAEAREYIRKKAAASGLTFA